MHDLENWNSAEQPEGWPLHPIDREPVITSPVIPNKDERATDSCFSLVGAHQFGVLQDVLG